MKLESKMKERKINLDLEGIESAKIIYHNIKDIETKTFLVCFDTKRRVLCSLEGLKKVKFVGNHYDPPRLWDNYHVDIEEYKKKICNELNLKYQDTSMLFTGADMDCISIKEEKFRDIKIYACVTAGVKTNAQRIGVDKAQSIEIGKENFEKLGTVNIMILTNASLTDAAMIRGIITVTEAKTIAFQDLNIRSSYNPELQATGTGTDNVIIASGNEETITYTGGHSKFGEMLARVTTLAVTEAILKQMSNYIKTEFVKKIGYKK